MTSSTYPNSFKATCVEGYQTPEVRRFLISQELVGNFQHLQRKLLTVFPKLGGQNFSVFWRDNEGDDITIASDEDLLIALGEMDGSVCKLIVKMREGVRSAESYSTHEGDHSLHNEETLSGVFRGNNQNNGGQSGETQEQNIPAILLTVLQILGINPNGFYFLPRNEGATGNRNNPCERIFQLMINQFLRISAMFTKVSITLSSITIMLFIMMILPSFLIHTALYLALAASLGLPLRTLLVGHLLFMLISFTPTFMVFTVAIYAFHRVCVLKKPLIEYDQDFWSFERLISHLQPQH